MTRRPSDHPARWIGRVLTVHVDRPIGSRHPRHSDMIYPVNYGFVPGTSAADGAEIDAYVLGPALPLNSFTGPCIAILAREDDVEDKLVVSDRRDLTNAAIRRATDFQERHFRTRLVRLRPG